MVIIVLRDIWPGRRASKRSTWKRELNLIESAQMISSRSQGWEFDWREIHLTVINGTQVPRSFAARDKLIYSCGKFVFARCWIKTLATESQNDHEGELVITPQVMPLILDTFAALTVASFDSITGSKIKQAALISQSVNIQTVLLICLFDGCDYSVD